jgi:hypothetical protein
MNESDKTMCPKCNLDALADGADVCQWCKQYDAANEGKTGDDRVFPVHEGLYTITDGTEKTWWVPWWIAEIAKKGRMDGRSDKSLEDEARVSGFGKDEFSEWLYKATQ